MYGVRSEVIELGVPMDVFRPLDRDEARRAAGCDWDGDLAVFVGRPDRTKGWDNVREVARSRPSLRILCVTPEPVEAGEGIIARSAVPNESMPVMYGAADVMLFPSRYESFGYSPVEAMACGVPVVASRTGALEDVDMSDAGTLIDEGTAEDYASALDDVLNGPKLHPRRAVEERFSLDRWARDWAALAERAVRQ